MGGRGEGEECEILCWGDVGDEVGEEGSWREGLLLVVLLVWLSDRERVGHDVDAATELV